MRKINRRNFIKATGVGGMALALHGMSVAETKAFTATRPNIILVMPDDVGYGDYACLGNPIMRTPSVDAFKTQSLLFTQFHVSPTCSPCRAALMSGRHEFKNGVTHTIRERERMSLSTFTLALHAGERQGTLRPQG